MDRPGVVDDSVCCILGLPVSIVYSNKWHIEMANTTCILVNENTKSFFNVEYMRCLQLVASIDANVLEFIY
eukprot:scaffold10429_cov126-Cylindrotheca_fusiformis.AAC.20